ncbi:hypothetical protein JCM19231_2824 [Vibrio ishigakensis]|uniref:Uncharacterized protein n=1 Tax=Vibrio ishigakensis TaxID=1481914 RepID=A0A0B8P2R0_9VIBR|nr:hypothetical protein JCM19231_2824 [Vibrio ishigakensis]
MRLYKALKKFPFALSHNKFDYELLKNYLDIQPVSYAKP